MLRVREIDIYYGDIQAVREVSLHVGKGEIVSIVGSNGAGKTTTLGALSGLIPIRSGEINFLGERIDGVSPHKIVEKGLVQIPEGRLLFPELPLLTVAVQAKVHIDLHQRPIRRTFALGDLAMAVLALEFGNPNVAAVCVEHVGREAEELVELQRVALGEQRRDTSRLARRALRRCVAHRAGLGIR